MNVFLSSTCYDLADARAVLETFLKDSGHVALLSDRNTFPLAPGRHRHDICLEQAKSADLFILVVDGRYGAPFAHDPSISITHAEFRAAADTVPTLAFVRRRIWIERDVRRRDAKGGGCLAVSSIADEHIFTLLDEIQKHPKGIWLVEFDAVTDVLATLKSLQTADTAGRPATWRSEELLEQYYKLSGPLGVQPLRVSLGDAPSTVTNFYTRPDWTRLNVPLESVICELSETCPAPAPPPDPAYAKLVHNRLLFGGAKLWNDPFYRLVSFDIGPGRARFGYSESSQSKFLDYRLSAGLMSDELVDAAKTHDLTAVLKDRESLLRHRRIWMPDATSLQDFGGRLSPGGIAALFAVARGKPDNDFLIPLHVRSKSLSENRGLAAVSFNGYHQPIVSRGDEVHLRWTMLRELCEEVFGREEVRRPPKRVKYDWYLDEPSIGYFRSPRSDVTCELLGFGINALVGNWECAVLLAVTDEDYWAKFGGQIEYGWEADIVLPVSTKKLADWKHPLQMRWSGDSLFALLAGLRRLRDLAPDRFGFEVDELGTFATG